MTRELRLFAVALQFLTRVPVPPFADFDPRWLHDCRRHFAPVGVLVGAWSGLVLWAASLLWPLPVASAVSLIATVWLTGGLHEDGLADTGDALGGAVDRERALAIMKDSRIGTYGALSLGLALGLKTLVVAAIAVDLPLAVAALVWSHAVSRVAPVFVMAWLPYAGDPAAARVPPLAIRATGAGPLVSLMWLGAIGLVVATVAPSADVVPSLLLSTVVAAAATAAAVRWLRRRLGGFTGDTLGAVQQVVDGVVLLAWLALFHLRHG